MGLGRSVWSPRYRARSNQATASLPPSSACSGDAGLGWHGPWVVLPTRRDLGESGAVALAFACACSAGPSPVWRIASVTRPRRSRGYRTERGLTAGRHHCGSALCLAGSQPEPGPRDPVKFDDLTGWEPRRADSAQPTLITLPVARASLAGGDAAGRTADYHSRDSEAGSRAPGSDGLGAPVARCSRAAMTQVTGRVLASARAVLCPSDASRTTGLALSRYFPATGVNSYSHHRGRCKRPAL